MSYPEDITPQWIRNATFSYRFGSHLALCNDTTLLVGAREADRGAAVQAGKAIFYLRQMDGTWVAGPEPVQAPVVSYAYFSHDFAVTNTLAFIAAPGQANGGTRRGSVFVFKYDAGTGTWPQIQEITGSLVDQSWFGASVSTDGSRVAVLELDPTGATHGLVWVYAINPDGTLALEGSFCPYNVAPVGGAGTSRRLLIRGDQIIVSCSNIYSSDGARTRVFREIGGVWTFRQNLMRLDPAYAWFDQPINTGIRYAFDGELLVVGYPAVYLNPGGAFIFRYDAADDWFYFEQIIYGSNVQRDTAYGFRVAIADSITVYVAQPWYTGLTYPGGCLYKWTRTAPRDIEAFEGPMDYLSTTRPSGATQQPRLVYQFDGSVDWLLDRTGNGYDLVINSGSISAANDTSSGLVGALFETNTELEAPGTDDTLRISKDDAGGGDASLTVEAVVRFNLSASGGGIVVTCHAVGESLETNALYQLGRTYSNNTYHEQWNERRAGWDIVFHANAPFANRQMVYLVMTVSADGQTRKYYQNGVYIGEATAHAAEKNSLGGNLQTIRVGMESAAWAKFRGLICGIRITAEEFSPAIVAAAYDEIKGTRTWERGGWEEAWLDGWCYGCVAEGKTSATSDGFGTGLAVSTTEQLVIVGTSNSTSGIKIYDGWPPRLIPVDPLNLQSGVSPSADVTFSVEGVLVDPWTVHIDRGAGWELAMTYNAGARFEWAFNAGGASYTPTATGCDITIDPQSPFTRGQSVIVKVTGVNAANVEIELA